MFDDCLHLKAHLLGAPVIGVVASLLLSRLHTLLNRSDYRREAVKRTVLGTRANKFLKKKNGIVATMEISNFFAKRFTQICIPIGTLGGNKNLNFVFHTFSNGI